MTRTQRKHMVLAAALVLWSIALFAQAPPSADTYVSSTYPTNTFGASTALVVQPGTTAYIKFNLSTLPANASLNKATLRLYVDSVVKNGKFDVYSITSSWSENTVTYNTAATVGGSVTGGQPISITKPSSLNQFVLIDITSLVQSWLDGTVPNNGVALVLTTSQGNFSSD